MWLLIPYTWVLWGARLSRLAEFAWCFDLCQGLHPLSWAPHQSNCKHRVSWHLVFVTAQSIGEPSPAGLLLQCTKQQTHCTLTDLGFWQRPYHSTRERETNAWALSTYQQEGEERNDKHLLYFTGLGMVYWKHSEPCRVGGQRRVNSTSGALPVLFQLQEICDIWMSLIYFFYIFVIY